MQTCIISNWLIFPVTSCPVLLLVTDCIKQLQKWEISSIDEMSERHSLLYRTSLLYLLFFHFPLEERSGRRGSDCPAPPKLVLSQAPSRAQSSVSLCEEHPDQAWSHPASHLPPPISNSSNYFKSYFSEPSCIILLQSQVSLNMKYISFPVSKYDIYCQVRDGRWREGG